MDNPSGANKSAESSSANLKTMKIVTNIGKRIGKVRTATIQKIHNQTGYLLSTTRAQRKELRKAARAEKRKEGKGFRNSVSQWRPFGFIGRKERQDDLGVSNPIAE